MKFIVPKKWSEFQHYKDRAPPWIKLHKALIDDCDFQSLPLASRALAPMLWLLASEHDDGKLPADTRRIAFRLRMNLQDLSDAFEPLIKAGFFEVIGIDEHDAITPLAECKQVAMPEKETQEDKKETQEKAETESSSLRSESCADAHLIEQEIPECLDRRKTKPNALNGHKPDFQAFYDVFPLHKARRQAEKAYPAALKRAGSAEIILAGARRYRDDPKRKPDFTKLPATWLGADCWLDEAEPTESGEMSAVQKALASLRQPDRTE